MFEKLTTLLKSNTTRHYVRVVASGVLGASLGYLFVSAALDTYRQHEYAMQTATTTEDTGTTTPAYTLSRSLPVRLSIPKMHLEANFEAPLGLNADGTVGVPKSFTDVGWYKYGPTPGELGPAVVLGHVDSYKGAAVFYHLGELAPGDLVYITREDGSVATFRVTGFERYPQAEFPTDQVYGNIDHAGLRLITCTGVYNHGTLRYDHNLVVYADLINPNATSTATSTTS